VTEHPLGPLFQTPHDPHYLWIFGCALAIPAIAAIAVGMVRGRLPTAWVLPAGLLPLFAYAVGYLFMLEESKSVAFCGSCHETMSPLVESLSSDDDSLAASHVRVAAVSRAQACYVCHSGYGIWGARDAKLAGVRHMWRTLTRSYAFPIEAHRFDLNSCLGCHAEAEPYRAAEDHHDPDVQQALLSGEEGCTGLCHSEAHPEEALYGIAGPPPGVDLDAGDEDEADEGL
jgi:hypothetical protein